jgi:hypothetical protein
MDRGVCSVLENNGLTLDILEVENVEVLSKKGQVDKIIKLVEYVVPENVPLAGVTVT